MSTEIIGRREEKRRLKEIITSKEAEFAVVYGRRRVGKTCLIRGVIEARKVQSIEVTGLKDGVFAEQLEIFIEAFVKAFGLKYIPSIPTSWSAAFKMLTEAIIDLPKNKKFVIFLDEIPWLATPKSGFLQALDHFWNTRWVRYPQIKLIVCGSAASWILDNLINAKGGLHNRLTTRILLKPFNFRETIEFLNEHSIRMSPTQVLSLYLVMGGIPYYLKAVRKGLSVSQNINQLCFTANGLLYNEFARLFGSLFDNSEAYVEIIRAIAKHPEGLDQLSLEKYLKLSKLGGTLIKRLNALEAAGFIISFVPYGRKKKGIYYKIIDEYTLFYIRWIEPVENRIKLVTSQSDYWQSKSKTASWVAWSGYAFEAFCYKHVDQITKALHIHTGFEIGTWRYVAKSKNEKGAQIDLLLDRDDGIINIIEIKYTQNRFLIKREYADHLVDRTDIFQEHFKTKKDIHLTMITVTGITENSYSESLVDSEVFLDDFLQ